MSSFKSQSKGKSPNKSPSKVESVESIKSVESVESESKNKMVSAENKCSCSSSASAASVASVVSTASKCIGCTVGKTAAHEKIKQTLADATAKNKVVIMPIVDCGYTFTIGLAKLAPQCGGEIVIVMGGQVGFFVINELADRIVAGTLKPQDWKEDDIIPVSGSIGSPLRIHLLGRESIDIFLTSSTLPFLNLPVLQKAYQIVWPNKDMQFTTQHVAHQMILG